MKLGFLLLIVGGAVQGGVQEINTEQIPTKQENIQEEILQAMKDSGVLEEMQGKLDNMLYETNEVDSNKPKKKPSHLTTQEEKMLQAFIVEYNDDRSTKVNPELVLSIIRRVVKAPSPNLPSIFVQLTPLLDVLSSLGLKSNKLTEIVERQSPVFQSPAKTKDILHTLTENLKSELVRITLDEKKVNKKTPPPPKKKPAAQKAKSGMDLNDYLSLGSTLLAGGNGAQLLNMLTGETDMSSMLSLLPTLLQNSNSQDLLKKMFYSYLDSTPYGPMVKTYLDSWLNSAQGKDSIGLVFKYADIFMKSESGQRLVKVLPKIANANDLDAFLELVHEEAEWNWAQVFDNFQNSDYKEKILEQASEYIVYGYEYFENPPKQLKKVPVLINGFLMSNGIPTFDSKKPEQSVIGIINKGLKLFTTVKGFDCGPYVKAISKSFSKAFDRQSKGNNWSELNSKQRSHLLARLIDNELVEPMQSVWNVYTHSVNNLECAEHLLCLVNHNERKNNVDSRIAVVKASSLAASWALAHVKNNRGEKYWNMYKAVWHGSKGEDCLTTYKVNGETCNIFAWQKTNFMSTNYDHIEL
eukprot:TRINITY_DN3941_c0_g1_i3.p1 TRINITY_DN3941_c0_g1~~TRINITY_DN3941_c0_g1_i3.p1  ORF type:complete len:581 (+),score=127.84 TRINITY_DN3941_c0_g1_i3:81-1823(+)